MKRIAQNLICLELMKVI